MRKSTRITAIRMLTDYPYLDNYIKERYQALKYPYQSGDSNVGGGKSQNISQPEETLVITIDEDKILHALYQEKEAVEKSINEISDSLKYVVKNYYWKLTPIKTLEQFGRDVGFSKTTIYRHLDILFYKILYHRGINEMLVDI